MSEIYLKSVVRRWKRDLAQARSEILVFSPYLTSDTAELVLRAARPDNCEIYTLFSTEHFATGGSSIRTLQLLLDEGFTIYELPGLHAKIVLVSGVSISVGSQNLTRGGTTNMEATVLIRDSKEVAKAKKELVPWLAARRPINPQMVLDMQASLPVLVRKFRRLEREAAAVDEAIQVGMKLCLGRTKKWLHVFLRSHNSAGGISAIQ